MRAWAREPVALAHLDCDWYASVLTCLENIVPRLAPGGVLVYSVCTMSSAETVGVDDHVARVWPELEPIGAPGEPWRESGRGGLLLPHVAGTDGMFIARYRVPDDRAASSPAVS